MGRGVPGVWSAAGQVDPLTGLARLDQLQAVMWAAMTDAERLPLAVVVAELSASTSPLEHLRRLTLTGAMAWTAFGSALAVGRLGVRRVGVLNGRDADLMVRAELLARLVHDLPAIVWLEPIAGSVEVAGWHLRSLCR
jgi:hypothetical protein